MQTGYRRFEGKGYRLLDGREFVRRGDKNAESADGPMTDVGAVGFRAGEVPELCFFRRTQGRPAKDAPNMVTIPVRVPPELLAKIEAKAQADGKVRGEWARDVLEHGVMGGGPKTLKEGEIAVRVDVLNAFRISPEDIREMISAMQRQSIEDLQESIKASGAWMLKEAEAKYGAKVCENEEERVA